MRESVAVIGTVFVDYKGFSKNKYNPLERNLGYMDVLPGGVARNVAVNLKYLGLDTWFLGTINDDNAGKILREQMIEYGVNVDYLKIVPTGGTGVWLAIIDEKGDLQGSISQMPNDIVMEKAMLPALPELFSKVNNVALEVDLNEKIVWSVLKESQKHNVKVYSLVGNLSVIKNNYDMFKHFECFVCNETEANILMQTELSSVNDFLEAIPIFAKKYKIKKFIVTLGAKGAVYTCENAKRGFQPAYPVKVVDSTGAGDAFFSGVVGALLKNKTLEEAVDIAAEISSRVISCKASDCSEFEF